MILIVILNCFGDIYGEFCLHDGVFFNRILYKMYAQACFTANDLLFMFVYLME